MLRRLYEKFLISDVKDIIDEKLCPQQAGFRSRRSTLEQVYSLHEIIIRNPGLICTFLDIKAAYDTVNRKRLWGKMVNMGIPPDLIASLRALFDHNTVQICIGSAKSEPIQCKRGLLQGSAISPILFDIYINDLIHELNDKGGDIRVGPTSLNNLFFADDLVIFARSINLSQDLLQVCEKWAKVNGLVFSIPKCATICTELSPLFLSDQIIPQVETFKYLGIYFDVNGINWQSDIEGRVQKASQMVNFLNSRGMHAYGWRFSSSLLAIKCFVRSIFDYGLALAPPDKLIAKMQVVIGEALRRMTSSRFNACRVALAKMLYMELMSSRARELEAKFRFRLCNSSPDTPAGIIYRQYSEVLGLG